MIPPEQGVASPNNLAAHAVPRRIEELDGHNCLRLTFRRSLGEWTFRELFARPVTGTLHGNSGRILHRLALTTRVWRGCAASMSRPASPPAVWCRCAGTAPTTTSR